MKEITMTFEEFFNKDLAMDKKELITLDKICGRILKNKKLKMAVLTSIAYSKILVNAYAADEFDQLRVGKNQVVMALQISICALCVIMCLLQIGKSLIGNRSDDIGSIVMKYLAAIVGVGVVPIAFKMVAKMFGIII